MASQNVRAITPLEDVSYRATSYIIPAGNGFPMRIVNATDPMWWVQQQAQERDPQTQIGQIEKQKAEGQKAIREILDGLKGKISPDMLQRILESAGEKIQGNVNKAVENVVTKPIMGASTAISEGIPGIQDKVENWVKGGVISIVLILLGLLVGAFGLYQLTKE